MQTDGHGERALAYRHYPASGEPSVPVVLVHGFGGDHLSWGRTAEALAAAGHDTYALDLPRHGRSGGDLGDASSAFLSARVHEFVEGLALPRVALVGHSLGGLVAMLTALRMPQTAAGVALIAPAGIHPQPGSRFLRAFLDADDEAALALAMADLVAPPATIPRAVVRSVWTWKQRPEVAADLGRLARSAFVDDGGLVLPGAALAAADVPTLIVWGDADAVLPVPQAEHLPGHARVEVLPRLGHSPHLEDPAATLPILLDFLGGLPR